MERINLKVFIVQMAAIFLVLALALFIPAGTIVWPAAWAFLGMNFILGTALSLWLYRHNQGLMKERMGGLRSVQKAWDKVFIVLQSILSIAWLVIMPLDAVRFGWSMMPIWLQIVGAVILLGSFYLSFLVFRENPFSSSVVRLQKDRGQTVVSTGPYSYVRHPLYSAFLLYVVGTALLLGSWYGLLLGLVLTGMLAWRAIMEERMLREGLEGYDAYMIRVKYRIIPHVW